jgi:phage gpG-like protein
VSYKGLQRLSGTLRALADVPSRASADAAGRIAELIEESFDSGTDPYGRPWAALAASTRARGRNPPPLTDTGSMRGSVQVAALPSAGIAVTIGTAYATFHQTGTKHMPQRQILPQSGGLAPSWRQAIADAVAANIRKALD